MSGGRNDNDKKADVIFHPKIYLPQHQVPFIFFFYFLFYAPLRLICLLQVPFLRACPLSQKTCLFLALPRESGFEHSFLMSDSLGVYLISLPASHTCLPLTVPFWRSWCTATWRCTRLLHSLDLTITLLFFISVSPWPSGAFFPFLYRLPDAFLLCKRKETSSFPQLVMGPFFEFPKGQARAECFCHSLVLSFHNFGYEL